MLRNLAEKFIWFAIVGIGGFGWNMFLEIQNLKADVESFKGTIAKDLEIITTNTNKNLEIIQNNAKVIEQNFVLQSDRINKLQESRDNLSNYYVTRIEFNRIIESQTKLLEKVDSNIQKLTEKFYEQK